MVQLPLSLRLLLTEPFQVPLPSGSGRTKLPPFIALNVVDPLYVTEASIVTCTASAVTVMLFTLAFVTIVLFVMNVSDDINVPPDTVPELVTAALNVLPEMVPLLVPVPLNTQLEFTMAPTGSMVNEELK